MKSLIISIILCCALNSVFCMNITRDHQPTHVHISFGNRIKDIVVTWVTFAKTEKSIVQYGTHGLKHRAEGKQTVFKDQKRTYYIHRVTLPHLKEYTYYKYRCGSGAGWSTPYTFHTPKYRENWTPRFLIFGDMGATNAVSLPELQEEAKPKHVDAIFHVGDFAYNFNSDQGKIGDRFMKQIEPIAARVPYMTAVGNHESYKNFTHYKNRFSMPGDNHGLWYSFNMGPIHFIILSTEVYYFTDHFGSATLFNQYRWLKKDLEEANRPENREKRPWIITMGHRPMYCSNDDKDDCTKSSDKVRVGIRVFLKFGLEKLFYDNNVDIEIWAHEHSYERTWPLYDYDVYNGTDGPYINPEAPVHIITGSAGCNEYVDHFQPKVKPWSAFRSSDYGYTRMKVHNKTHIQFEQVSVNIDKEVIDSFTIVKDQPANYPKRENDSNAKNIPNVILF